MTSLPDVTVVIPTRARRDSMVRAVRSVLDQDYAGCIECIVVFDGEPAAGLEGLPTTPNRQLRSLENPTSRGTAAARNIGMSAAQGEVLAFCDDDDEWFSSKLRRQVELLQTQPELTVVSCGLVIVVAGRHEIRRPFPQARVSLESLLQDRIMELHPSALVVRRSLVRGRLGGFDELIPGSYAEDYDWLLRAAEIGPIGAVTEPLVRINWFGDSYYFSRWQTIVGALEYLLRKHPELEKVPRGFARIAGQIAFAKASAGERSAAVRWALRALKASPIQPRAYAALMVASGLLSAERFQRALHARGRGV